LFYGEMEKYTKLEQELNARGLFDIATSAHADRLDYGRGRNVREAKEVLAIMSKRGDYQQMGLSFIHGVMDMYDRDLHILLDALRLAMGVPGCLQENILTEMLVYAVLRNRFDWITPRIKDILQIVGRDRFKLACENLKEYIDHVESFGMSLAGQMEIAQFIHSVSGVNEPRDFILSLPINATEEQYKTQVSRLPRNGVTSDDVDSLFDTILMPITPRRLRLLLEMSRLIFNQLQDSSKSFLDFFAVYGNIRNTRTNVFSALRRTRLLQFGVRQMNGLPLLLPPRSVDAYWTILANFPGFLRQLPYTTGFSVEQWRELLRRRVPDADIEEDAFFARQRLVHAMQPLCDESPDVVTLLLRDWLGYQQPRLDSILVGRLSHEQLELIFPSEIDFSSNQTKNFYWKRFEVYLIQMCEYFEVDAVGPANILFGERYRWKRSQPHLWRNFVWIVRWFVRLPESAYPSSDFHRIRWQFLYLIKLLVHKYPAHVTHDLYQELFSLKAAKPVVQFKDPSESTSNLFEKKLPIEMRLEVLKHLPWSSLKRLYNTAPDGFDWVGPVQVLQLLRLRNEAPTDDGPMTFALQTGDVELLGLLTQSLNTPADFRKTRFANAHINTWQEFDFDAPAPAVCLWLLKQSWALPFIIPRSLFPYMSKGRWDLTVLSESFRTFPTFEWRQKCCVYFFNLVSFTRCFEALGGYELADAYMAQHLDQQAHLMGLLDVLFGVWTPSQVRTAFERVRINNTLRGGRIWMGTLFADTPASDRDARTDFRKKHNANAEAFYAQLQSRGLEKEEAILSVANNV